ncbi:AAA family ATPase [Streptomyces sp. NPDC004542]|uniref:AAA family ATPase n=1 Tax=Streptomyces sp. NPDC004542 TaxID=3154281 RepID=UPI0033B1A32A
MTVHQGGADMGERAGSIRLPQVRRLRISHFSLYRNRSENVVDFDKNVFCLSGANGLGKSTFLAILNYALTGAVAPPEVKVLSLSEYSKSARSYAPDYFTGRVKTDDREIAEVSVEFTIGEYEYEVTRGFFDGDALRSLRVKGPDVDLERAGEFGDPTLGREIMEEYETLSLKHAGLASFDQLIYVQHFLVTFDERRHLLFWDPEVARFALFLVFGLDSARADAAGEWQRKADRLESQARNAQYQATSARAQIRDLLERSGGSFELNEELEDKHRSLLDQRDSCAAIVDQRLAQEKDARLQVGIAAADHHSLTTEYDRAFNSRLSPKSGPTEHPLIHKLIHDQSCGICGTASVDSIAEVERILADNRCPLCHSDTSSSDEGEDFDLLRELDVRLQQSAARLKAAQEDAERAEQQRQVAQDEFRRTTRAIEEFERENSDWVRNKAAHSGVSDVIKQLQAEFAAAQDRRDRYRQKRDEYQALLTPVKRELAEKYAEAELEFVPRFQSLARAFLGMDLHCRLDQRARGPELIVTIDRQPRREQNQLSESQRYFIDIALRMALTEHMLNGASAGLYIDTPEGSLDIAYESRAGEMFGAFVGRGNRLIMTANLNSNRLVLELAHVCGRELMHVERMTNWSVLSEVQADSEELFDESYAAIQASLDGRMF